MMKKRSTWELPLRSAPRRDTNVTRAKHFRNGQTLGILKQLEIKLKKLEFSNNNSLRVSSVRCGGVGHTYRL